MDAEDFLGELHLKSYEREIDESESIWRSLPLFTVSFGFAAALLNYLAAFARFEFQIWPVLTLLLLLLPATAFGWAFRWFWDVIRIRTFRYVPSDIRVRKYADEMTGFYQLIGGTDKQIAHNVLKALKDFYYGELAEAASQNQKNNQSKAKARSLVAFWLTTGFALAFLSTAIILAHEKIYGQSSTKIEQASAAKPCAATVKERGKSSATVDAASSIYPRGSGKSVSKGERRMSKEQAPPAPQPPSQAPARPAPPEPIYVQKDHRPPEKR